MSATLVATYLSVAGVAGIRTQQYADAATCHRQAAAYVKQIRVGSGKAWCVRNTTTNNKGNKP